ncbi:MAG: hypothetical protein JST04_12305 [Bdellovibrionales bacterium]|nr:hypothetical protein [Bdellovibrionales bacterium]
MKRNSNSALAATIALFALGIAGALPRDSHPIADRFPAAFESADPEEAKDDSWFKIPNPREVCTSSTEMTNLCLEVSLKYRCYNYGNFSLLHLQGIRSCLGGISKLMKVMNIVQVPIGEDEKSEDDPVEKSGLLLKQVLFQTDLEKIFNDPKTSGLFQAAQADMQDSARFGREHNFWDSVYAKSGNDRQTTLKFLAEAVQDVSFGIWHIMYLGRKFEAQGLTAESVPMKNLKTAQEFIQLYQTNIEKKDFPFTAYPAIDGKSAKRIDRDLHPYLHHFYLPAYLSSEIRRLGKTEKQAFFAAFLLNTGYEFVKHDAAVGDSRWPFHDPKPFANSAAFQERLRKIYTGYVGALWGIGKEAKAKSFAEFAADLAKDPYGSMQKYSRIDF